MSVETESDRHLDSAQNEIDHAIKSLAEIVINKAWGWDEFSKKYFKTMTRVMFDLIDIQSSLNGNDEVSNE